MSPQSLGAAPTAYCFGVRFNPRADISGGRVRDVRGGAGGGGGLGNLPMGAISGGGIGTTIVVIIIIVIVQFAGGGGSGLGSTGPEQTTDRYDKCLSGADANQSEDCARRAVEASLE